MKKGVLRNSKRLTRKNLCQSLFLIKLQTETCNFIKKESLAQVFSCEFREISKITFLQSNSGLQRVIKDTTTVKISNLTIIFRQQ